MTKYLCWRNGVKFFSNNLLHFGGNLSPLLFTDMALITIHNNMLYVNNMYYL